MLPENQATLWKHVQNLSADPQTWGCSFIVCAFICWIYPMLSPPTPTVHSKLRLSSSLFYTPLAGYSITSSNSKNYFRSHAPPPTRTPLAHSLFYICHLLPPELQPVEPVDTKSSQLNPLGRVQSAKQKEEKYRIILDPPSKPDTLAAQYNNELPSFPNSQAPLKTHAVSISLTVPSTPRSSEQWN